MVSQTFPPLILPLLLLLTIVAGAAAQSPAPAPAQKFPALNVQVTVGTQQRAEQGSFYRKTMTIRPKVTIEGASRMVPLPAIEATMLIITMDTRAKYTKNEKVFSVHTTETMEIPAARSGERRQFAFAESSVTYDSYRDKSNVGGAIYEHYVFGLRDPATKEIVEFKTNNQSLQNFVKTHPEKRAEFLGLTKGANFPGTFK